MKWITQCFKTIKRYFCNTFPINFQCHNWRDKNGHDPSYGRCIKSVFRGGIPRTFPAPQGPQAWCPKAVCPEAIYTTRQGRAVRLSARRQFGFCDSYPDDGGGLILRFGRRPRIPWVLLLPPRIRMLIIDFMFDDEFWSSIYDDLGFCFLTRANERTRRIDRCWFCWVRKEVFESTFLPRFCFGRLSLDLKRP